MATLHGVTHGLERAPHLRSVALGEESAYLPSGTIDSGPISGSSSTPLSDGWLRFSPQVAEKLADFGDRRVQALAQDSLIYFPRHELSVAPVLRDEPQIDAPGELEKNELRGEHVSIRVFVRASGDVDHVDIETSTSSTAYEKAAVTAFLPLHFRPGEINGVAVSSQVVFEIDFDVQARGVSRSSDQSGWWDRVGLTGPTAFEAQDSRTILQETRELDEPKSTK